MKKKAIITILTSIILCWFYLSFAQQSGQVKPVPQQKPPEKFVQKAAPPQMARKTITIDPNMLQRLRTPLSRPTLINTLMGNQVTRSAIESSARNAKVQVNELPTKGLDGKMISAQPQGRTIDQLNWNAGIKFSLIKNNAKFFHPKVNREIPVGYVEVAHVDLDSNTVSQDFSNDVFYVIGSGNTAIALWLLMPLNVATYMIATQGHPLVFEVVVDDASGQRKLDNALPLSTGEGSVGNIIISPYPDDKWCGHCIIYVKPRSDLHFGGFTIARL